MSDQVYVGITTEARAKIMIVLIGQIEVVNLPDKEKALSPFFLDFNKGVCKDFMNCIPLWLTYWTGKPSHSSAFFAHCHTAWKNQSKE